MATMEIGDAVHIKEITRRNTTKTETWGLGRGQIREDLKSTLLKVKHNQCCSVAMSCPTLCNSMACNTPAFHVLHYLLEFAQTNVDQVGDAMQLSHLCHPLFFLPSIFPSIKVFSSESALHIQWPKYWSFSLSFSVSPSSEYSVMTSFRID